MVSGKLNIVLHSGKDLPNVKHLSNMSPYAKIWISGDGMDETKHKTGIARNGGCNPVWECSIDFKNVSMNKANNLVIEIKHEGRVFPTRKIGRVQVPFEELLAGDAAADKVSHRVTIPSGDHTEGEIILSHRFTEVVSIGDQEDDTPINNPDKPSTSSGAGTKTSEPVKKKSGIVKKIAAAAGSIVATVVAPSIIIGATDTVLSEVFNDEEDEKQPSKPAEEDENEQEI